MCEEICPKSWNLYFKLLYERAPPVEGVVTSLQVEHTEICTSSYYMQYGKGSIPLDILTAYRTPSISERFEGIDQHSHCTQIQLWFGVTSGSHNVTNVAKSKLNQRDVMLWPEI
jgi:hypothetical protein